MSTAMFGHGCRRNLSRLNMTATTKKVLLSYYCIHCSNMLSILIPNLSKQNQILTKLTGTIC